MVESASLRFSKIISIVRYSVRFCGADVSKPNFRMNWVTYLVIFAMFLAFSCGVYTVYMHVVVNKSWALILQTVAMIASGLQGLSKFVAVLSNGQSVTSIQHSFMSIYQEYENKGGTYTDYLYNRCRITWKLIVFFMWVYGLVIVGVLFFPMLHLFVFKEKLLVLQFLVPGIDETTHVGYIMLFCIHIMCLSFGGIGNFGGDMYLFLFVTNVPLLADIFRVKMQEFNQVVLEENSDKKRRTMLWELLAWHQSYVSILRRTQEIFNITMFVQLFTSCGGILSSIICIFIGVWPAAPVYLVYSFVLLYTFCALGTIVENSNGKFADVIYSNCVWYELPVVEEKLIIIMLAKAQKEKALNAAGVMPLSMETAMVLTKGIYSFTMMMLTYLK